jgi:hypothetical protein
MKFLLGMICGLVLAIAVPIVVGVTGTASKVAGPSAHQKQKQ